MYHKNVLLISILILIQKSSLVKCDDINMTLYYTFPLLYQYDDYDRCLFANPNKLSAYCLTDVEIVPAPESELWRNIEEFSKDGNRHYRHDVLNYALCVNWCEEKLKDLTDSQREQLYKGTLANTRLVEYVNGLYANEEGNRYKYNKLLNQCVNLELKTKYNLTATSNIKYCKTSKDTIEIDSLDVAFLIVTFILLALNLSSSFYDFLLKKKLPHHQQTNEYYQKNVNDPRQSFFLSFSICRNYYRLTRNVYESSSNSRELRFIDTFKFFMMLGVISSHLMELLITIGLQNSEHFEKFLHRFDKNILINASGLMQCFFQLSGFLVMVGFHENISKISRKKVQSIPLFLKMVFLRYIRLTPLMAYGVFFASTLLYRLGDGPIWRLGVEREHVFCRKNWWINLLFVQNYVDTERACMPQSWYIAVDLQAFIICAAIIILSYKYPSKTKYIFGIPIILALISPGIAVFMYNIPGVYFHTPEYFRQLVYFNDKFKQMYIPTQNNVLGYISGVLTGKVYLHFKSKNIKMSSSKVAIFFWYVMVIIGFLNIFSAEIYYQYEVPNILAALHGGVFRLVYALLFGYVIIGMTDRIGWIGYEFSSLPIFRVLGRLTYSVLIVQVDVILMVFSVIRSPQYQSDLRLIIYSIGMIGICYLFAFIVTLIIELPVTAIMKQLFSRSNTPKKILPDEPKQQTLFGVIEAKTNENI